MEISDNVFIDEHDLVEMKNKAHCLAVARVNMTKTSCSEALFQTVCYIWGLANNPELQEVDGNIFTFIFFCLGDWNEVMT
jgi:hypothetical protein